MPCGLGALVCFLGGGSRFAARLYAAQATDDKAAIEAAEQQYIKTFNAKDVNAGERELALVNLQPLPHEFSVFRSLITHVPGNE